MKFALRLSFALTFGLAIAALSQIIPLLKWDWRDLMIERYGPWVATFLGLVWLHLFVAIRWAQRGVRFENLGSRLRRAEHEKTDEIAALSKALYQERV
jgi:hypothetical protein